VINDMSHNLDDELRVALRPVDPGEDFAQRVQLRIAQDSTQSRRPVKARYQWLPVALAASVVLGFLISHDWQTRREQQGLEARRQLIEALRVTSAKLDLAYRVVNDEARASTNEISGA
jgi:hypothetical protein